VEPDPAGPRFLDSRALTDDQIRVIQEWVKQGAPEGERGTVAPMSASSSARSGHGASGPPDLIALDAVGVRCWRLMAQTFFRTFVPADSEFVRAST
jgi:hypothetical protein